MMLMSTHRRQPQRRAVTIVELLVVAGIIATLLGVLMPALSGVRALGRTTESLSNLRQMAIAANNYASDYRHFPAAIRRDIGPGGGVVTIAWDWRIDEDGRATPGALWRYTDQPGRVMQDPWYDGPANALGDPFTGYNYNTSFLGAEQTFGAFGWDGMRPGIPAGACSRPDQCAVFGQGGYAGGANKFMRAPGNRERLSLATIYSGGQAFRARGATLVSYVDGHVARIQTPHQGPHVQALLLDQYMGWPHSGFLSHDDRAYDPR